MRTQDAMNIMLTAVQQEAINDTETQDYEVSQLQAVLDQAKKEILTQNAFAWNSALQTLSVDTNDEIRIPDGVLRFDMPTSLKGRLVERQRGEPLWDRINNVAWTTSVQLLLFNDVDFDLIPDVFAQWIAWRAAELFDFKLNGLQGNTSYIREQLKTARMNALNSEFCSLDGMSEFNSIRAASSGFVQGR